MEDIYRNGNYRRKSSHRSKHSNKAISYRPQYNSNNRNNKNYDDDFNPRFKKQRKIP